MPESKFALKFFKKNRLLIFKKKVVRTTCLNSSFGRNLTDSNGSQSCRFVGIIRYHLSLMLCSDLFGSFYFYASSKLNYLRAMNTGGVADLNHPEEWNFGNKLKKLFIF